MNKTDRTVKNETFFMDKWEDEDYINAQLEELGFDMENTTWVYSWTIPSWVSDDKREIIRERLESTDYKGYLINVRQEIIP